jgi:hypothetical protein
VRGAGASSLPAPHGPLVCCSGPARLDEGQQAQREEGPGKRDEVGERAERGLTVVAGGCALEDSSDSSSLQDVEGKPSEAAWVAREVCKCVVGEEEGRGGDRRGEGRGMLACMLWVLGAGDSHMGFRYGDSHMGMQGHLN